MRNITLFINENYVFMSIENAYLIEIFMIESTEVLMYSTNFYKTMKY